MKEILPGVFTWSWPSPEKGYDFNGWYVRPRSEAVIIDPVKCADEETAEMERRGTPTAILLTNKDHVREAERFASLFRAPVFIHQADAPLVSIRLGGLFKHGDDLPGGLEVVRIPDAKTPGECALLSRSANALIVGDALIGHPAGQLNLLPPEKFADAEKAREGIRILLNYHFEAVLTGDGEPILRGGRKAIESFLLRAGA